VLKSQPLLESQTTTLTVTYLPRNALAELVSFVIHKLEASDDFAKILAPD
jgi:hypothetical protein